MKIKKLYFKLNKKAYSSGKMPVIDIIFKKIHETLGGNMEFMFNGSSALPKEVIDFLQLCTGCRVTGGFGMSETCVSGLFNHFG